MPLYALFQVNYIKAKRQGLILPKDHNRTVLESVKMYLIEFDAMGVLLLCAGLSLFLLPFNLVFNQGDGWKSPMIIGMIVAGVVCCILFALYEKYLAPKTFIPYKLLTDRTVLGACILAAVLFISFYVWNACKSLAICLCTKNANTSTSLQLLLDGRHPPRRDSIFLRQKHL